MALFEHRGQHRRRLFENAVMSEADETRAIIAEHGLRTNQLLTQIMLVIQDNQDLAARIRGVSSHNLDLATAAGLLDSSISEDLRTVINRYRLVIQILEQYSGKVL